MELQLGLALPSHPTADFDLKKYAYGGYGPNQLVGTEIWSHGGRSGINQNNKRSFDDTFDKSNPEIRTLPLLSWNDKPNDDDDYKGRDRGSSCFLDNKVEEEANSIVGWPPINSWRKKLHHQHQGGGVADERIHRDENACRGPNSKYVKVKMEGLAIGRKIDLSLYSSYQTLTSAVISMFGKYQSSVQGAKSGPEPTSYTLVYQDREGDWLLVGDAPWETFIGSVQRMKLIKRSGG
ncbi:PREDICTED: auxin-responsive protein IAA5-like [Nelumbo nucifera]|uniref:Auxin-responsive protein n=2 Tax=Nelumbo nucifera TaxID=4432 RepID=A0A1U7ZNJ0_NELNU|nr:PREDICTED: auxin-responsive protein IAA5-like [Nelumbo nucifera]DAD44957.1 TPA_asm: hypothetical protein HUJ06_003187 [Nelumbo nucifera]